MTSHLFYEEGSTRLRPEAFEFVLTRELRRAVRSQNFLTLVVFEAAREWDGMKITADAGTLQELGQIIATDVRETDLLGHSETSTLALVLLAADVEHATRVIDRLAFLVEHDESAMPLRVAVGTACCPTHAVGADGLTGHARSRPIARWHSSSGSRPAGRGRLRRAANAEPSAADGTDRAEDLEGSEGSGKEADR